MGGSLGGFVGVERDPSLAFLARAQPAPARDRASGERPIEARVRTLQATAGNAAVGQMLQRQATTGTAGGTQTDTPTHPLLKYGDRGDEVRDLQGRLNELGATATKLAIDGIFGRKTQAAVRRFQETHPPLAVDGDAGPETWSALDKARSEPAAQTGQEPPAADPFALGKEHYAAGRYGRAYDEFTKAYEQSGEIEHLWNRAQALRLLGGRREEAIALYQQLINAGVADDVKKRALEQIAALRGPGRTGDQAKDVAAAYEIFVEGQKLYQQEEYGRAYDEFTKAHEITRDPALLFNRAQALRLLGGRRAEAINLYEAAIAAEIPEDWKKVAASEIADLRGPGSRPDEHANRTAADALYQEGRKHYQDEAYAQAYDAFSKAHEISGDPALLYNRAQALRLLGGRRAYAIALFEQFIASDVPEDARKAARVHLEDLKGPGRKDDGSAPGPPR